MLGETDWLDGREVDKATNEVSATPTKVDSTAEGETGTDVITADEDCGAIWSGVEDREGVVGEEDVGTTVLLGAGDMTKTLLEVTGAATGVEVTGAAPGVDVTGAATGVEVTGAATGVVVTGRGGSKSTITSSSTTMVVSELGSSAS